MPCSPSSSTSSAGRFRTASKRRSAPATEIAQPCPWNLASFSRRVDKYILVEVSQSPGPKDLEALRDMGVSGLVVDVAAAGAEGLAALKTALLEMPRATSRNRSRSRAILPGSAFAPPEQQPQHDDDDDEDDDYSCLNGKGGSA